MTSSDALAPPILFFDGVCTLCNASVDFIIEHEAAAVLRFASLQGETALELLGEDKARALQSLVLWQDGDIVERSSAALRVARHLRAPWRWLRVFQLVPRPLRDLAYDWVARNRYRWFGRNETCRVPKPEERARFLP